MPSTASSAISVDPLAAESRAAAVSVSCTCVGRAARDGQQVMLYHVPLCDVQFLSAITSCIPPQPDNVMIYNNYNNDDDDDDDDDDNDNDNNNNNNNNYNNNDDNEINNH